MTLPKKGSRLISVDGVSYRWLVTGNDMVIDVIVEQDEANGQKLKSQFKYHDHAPDGSSTAQRRTISPETIHQLISQAIKQGWQPGTPGLSDFVIDGEKVIPLE